jgi:predicted enzyme related to lactoylglutathione lyase
LKRRRPATETLTWRRHAPRQNLLLGNTGEDGPGIADFYSSIFGWTVTRRGDGELAFDDTGGVSGTWVKESDRTPDERTRTYIMVDGIAETLKRIEAAGGRVLTPRTELGPGMGAFAIFADPVGNEFGLYEERRR